MRATLALVLCLSAAALAFKNGAPVEVCEDMTPQHGAPVQPSSSNPYQVKLAKSKIQPGESVQLTLSGKRGESFKGFLIQARVGSTPIGQFSTNKDAKTINCGSAKLNAATHTSADVKKSVSVTWTAPKDLKERVEIYYTVAQDGGKYWVAEKAGPLSVA